MGKAMGNIALCLPIVDRAQKDKSHMYSVCSWLRVVLLAPEWPSAARSDDESSLTPLFLGQQSKRGQYRTLEVGLSLDEPL